MQNHKVEAMSDVLILVFSSYEFVMKENGTERNSK